MISLREFSDRFANRLRHGLLTQEVLDRLARAGLRIYPYFLVYETLRDRPELTEGREGFETRFLRHDELAAVSEIPARPQRLERLRARTTNGACFGVWHGPSLAAYTWYSSRHLPAAAGGHRLCALPPRAAYLYDAYVLPEYRGHRIAGFMRHKCYEALAETGFEHFFSVTLAFNRSSRRFKDKLAAEEFETRLLVSLGRLYGIDCCVSRKQNRIDAPRVLRIRPGRRVIEEER